jgi:hypothetical protein
MSRVLAGSVHLMQDSLPQSVRKLLGVLENVEEVVANSNAKEKAAKESDGNTLLWITNAAMAASVGDLQTIWDMRVGYASSASCPA